MFTSRSTSDMILKRGIFSVVFVVFTLTKFLSPAFSKSSLYLISSIRNCLIPTFNAHSPHPTLVVGGSHQQDHLLFIWQTVLKPTRSAKGISWSQGRWIGFKPDQPGHCGCHNGPGPYVGHKKAKGPASHDLQFDICLVYDYRPLPKSFSNLTLADKKIMLQFLFCHSLLYSTWLFHCWFINSLISARGQKRDTNNLIW